MNPQDTVFIPVPVSEKPGKEGAYKFLTPDGYFSKNMFVFKDGKWPHGVDKSGDYSHWLKPVKLSEIIASQPVNYEQAREIARAAWIGAANAYRMYPDNKHTFVDYWDSYGKLNLPKPTSVKGEEHELINESLDFYWRHCVSQLEGNDLGDIERKNYEGLKNKLYTLINKSQS